MFGNFWFFVVIVVENKVWSELNLTRCGDRRRGWRYYIFLCNCILLILMVSDSLFEVCHFVLKDGGVATVSGGCKRSVTVMSRADGMAAGNTSKFTNLLKCG